MFCKNCGFENPDGAKFCGRCGQKIEMSPQNNVPENNVNTDVKNNIPQNNAPNNYNPQGNAPKNSIPQNNQQQNVQHNYVHQNPPQGGVRQGNATHNVASKGYNPQGNVQQNSVPNNYNPQGTMPQNNIPNNYVPQNGMPQNGMPQYNNFQTQVNQTVVDPVTGQPVKSNGFKKHLPLILGIAGGVVAVIVAIVIVFSVVSGSGINGVLDNLEDGINNKNVESIKKCVPEFMAKDMNIDQSDVDKLFGISDEYDFEIDFDVKSEEDVTDSKSSDSNYTWKEYIQDQYESNENYDGGEVQEVKKANVKFDIDFDNDTANAIAGLASALSDESLTKDIYFVKYDGSWYLYDI